jgi:hypothetical protein
MRIKNPTSHNLRILHRRLWKWLALNPSKQKKSWPGWKEFNELDINKRFRNSISNECFACQEAIQRKKSGDLACFTCPITWGEYNFCVDSEYKQWKKASTFLERSALATKIANQPWSDREEKS